MLLTAVSIQKKKVVADVIFVHRPVHSTVSRRQNVPMVMLTDIHYTDCLQNGYVRESSSMMIFPFDLPDSKRSKALA